MMRIVSGRICKPSVVFPEYEVVVEHAGFSWSKLRRVSFQQVFRGNGLWKCYPQGSDASSDMETWLNQQTQQFEWAQEHTEQNETLERFEEKFGVLREVLDELASGSCACGTKSTNLERHRHDCKYRNAATALQDLQDGLDDMIRAG